MYKMLYGDKMLFDAYSDDERIMDASLSQQSVNVPAYLDFTISITHPLYSILAERADTVYLYSNDEKIFEGVIDSITEDFNRYHKISCVSALDFLSDTYVRPYSTSPENGKVVAPTNGSQFFQWLIDQHNAHAMDSRKGFTVGVNQGSYFEDYMARDSDSMETTFSELKKEFLDKYGAYLTLTYEHQGIKTLNLYADVHDMNDQIIDFGENLTDFTKTIDTKDQYTALYPKGGTRDRLDTEPSDVKIPPTTIASLPDGVTQYNSDIVKYGDIIYSESARARYGYREYVWNDPDTKDAATLLARAVPALLKLISPSLTITVKAVDLSLYMSGYHHLNVGQAVRIRSKPHGVDEYLMVTAVDINLTNPSQTEYTLGTSYDTLTGQQSSYLESLNRSINAAVDKAASISADMKDLSSKAIVSTIYEYASSLSMTDPPEDGWSITRPSLLAGMYIWQRVTTQYGDGISSISDPVMLTGNSASVMRIDSSRGLVFKNNEISTILTVTVFYGPNIITDSNVLKNIFGSGAYLQWSYKGPDDAEFLTIASDDSKLSNNGFTLTITPSDVDTKTVFQCNLEG